MSYSEPTVLLAALEDGTHIQVGKAREYADAYDLFERFDSEVSGYVRINGRMHHRLEGVKDHYFGGQAVRFYRLRMQGENVAAEFGNVRQFRISDLRYTNRTTTSKEDTITTKTPSGIKRPHTVDYGTWERARTAAKRLNESNGRGYRALRTAKGDGYTVIFRPAVAVNKQRRVREIVR